MKIRSAQAGLAASAGLMLAVLFPAPAEARYRGTDPVCVSGNVSGGTLSVRSLPRGKGRRVGRLAANTCGMNVESVEGNWTYIRGTDYRGRNIEGWVNNRYLQPAYANPAPGGGGGGQAPGGFPIAAASGGGSVRSGPGTKYKKIGSTGQFEPLTVLRNTGAMMNGYPWFEIQLQSGRRGYQWGGIICSTAQPFSGTFDTCDNFRRALGGNTGAPAAAYPQRRRVQYSCNEGIPLIVTFVEEQTESYALYSHDSGPTNRVAATPSGSGFAYSNGYHELRGKGGDIDLIEGGNVIDSCTAN